MLALVLVLTTAFLSLGLLEAAPLAGFIAALVYCRGPGKKVCVAKAGFGGFLAALLQYTPYLLARPEAAALALSKTGIYPFLWAAAVSLLVLMGAMAGGGYVLLMELGGEEPS